MLLLCALAYHALSLAIMRDHGEGSLLRTAVGEDRKGKLSLVLYAAAIGLAFVERWAGFAIYWVVAVIWLIPDRRIERVVRG